jgi:hypothetical protein
MTIATRWVICLPRTELPVLAELLSDSSVYVGFEGETAWVQGELGSLKDVNQGTKLGRLSRFLCEKRFLATSEDLLVPLGRKIPVGKLPRVDWRPLRAELEWELPVAMLSGLQPPGIELRLVRGASKYHGPESPAELLECELADLRSWAACAAQERISAMRFVIHPSGRALVRGQSLPAIPGRRYSLLGGIAVPLGWSWRPLVKPETVREVFDLAPGLIAVWREEQCWEGISAELFLPLSRGALWATESRILEHGADGRP